MTHARTEDTAVHGESRAPVMPTLTMHERRTPAEYGRIAAVVRTVRNGADSAARAVNHPRLTRPAGPHDAQALACERAHARGYALGWSAAATLVQLAAADAGAQLANDDPD